MLTSSRKVDAYTPPIQSKTGTTPNIWPQHLTWGIPGSGDSWQLPGIPTNPWESAFRPNPSRIPLLPVFGPKTLENVQNAPKILQKPKSAKICAFGARIHRSERPGILPPRSV